MEKENSNINYKSNINQNSLIRKNSNKKTTIRQNKKKRSSCVIDSSTPSLNKRFESLINIHDDSFIYKSDENKHNTTYTLNPKVKKLLLKDYKQDIKREKKYRKIKIINNLNDSSQSSEESSEENENIGLNFYISSESNFIFIFDSILLFFSLFCIIFIPLDLAERIYYCKNEKNIFIVFQFITEILYIIDLIISFFRSYYDYEYKYITQTYLIIQNYLTDGFLFDLISAIPFYSINKSFCKNIYTNLNSKFSLTIREIISTALLFLKSFKVLKILNHQKNKVIEKIYEKISDNMFLEKLVDMLLYFLKIFSFLHTLICLHIFIGEQTFPNWMFHIKIQNEDLTTKYISSFYFIIETMTTVGYGDVICISFIEVVFQLILLSIGIVSYSFIITKFGNYIMKKSKADIELEEEKMQLEQIRIQYPLMPFKLYIKIQDYLTKKVYKKNSKKNEMNKLIENLPEQLKNELLLIINRDIIKNFIIFKDCNNTDFIIKIISCFIKTICKKETVLIKEGEQVENMIFVKDGRLILEATIDLSKPLESYKKYFKENFKFLNDREANNESILSGRNTNNNEESNNEENLTKKLNFLIENLKNGNAPNILINRRSSFLLRKEMNDSKDEKDKSDNINKDKQEEKYRYLKVLDIRKNEHFGNVFMFLEKPAPLSLVVKSKIAEIFILRKKDAMMINNLHHNIFKRIQDKSFKNLVSIKKKTFKIIRKYYNLNNIHRSILEDKTLYNEKSKEILLQDLTNIISNSMLLNENNNLGGTSIIYQNLKNLLNENDKTRLSRVSNSYSDKKNIDLKNSNLLSSQWVPKVKKSINMKRNSINMNFPPKILIKNSNTGKINTNNRKSESVPSIHIKLNSGTANSIQTNNSQSNKTSIKNCQNQIVPVASKFKNSVKTSNKEISDDDSIDLTKEEKLITLNNLREDFDNKIRKKIKASVKKDKLLKLSKIHNDLINFYQKEIDKSLLNDVFNLQIINNFSKISELSNNLYISLLEFLDTDYDSESERIENKSHNIKNQFILDRTINFKIKASYYNLNNLTKGKILKNDKCKEDIKKMVEKYINKKKENSMNLINEFIKLYANEKKDKKNSTNIDGLPHIDNISLVFNNIINDSPKKNKKKYVPKAPRHSKTKKSKMPTPRFISNLIKKTRTNQKEVYQNFKNMEYDGKSSQLILNKNKNKTKSKKNATEKKSNFDYEKNNIDEKESNDNSNIFSRMIDKIFYGLNIK